MTVLIAEDDPGTAAVLADAFSRCDMTVVHASDGRRALELHLSLRPDLVLLDIRMPYIDGWQVLSEIRRRGPTPVIILTAYDQDIDKLMGLRLGADDYVVKPFNPAEVVARAQAVLRRSHPHDAPLARSVLRAAPFEVDLDRHCAQATIGGKTHVLDLTLTEFKLLAEMVRNPRRVFSRLDLLTLCSPDGSALERTMDSHLSKLRRKLTSLGITGMPGNVRGVGYRLWTDE